ncbi:hypothetical protein SLA2020_397090 [Shorea laevis]
MENSQYSESEECWSLWLFKDYIPETLSISETICQPQIPIQSSEQTLLTTGESQPLLSPEQFVRESHHQIPQTVSQPLLSIHGGDEQTLLMAGESQPPQGKPAKRKNNVGGSSEAGRLTRKREYDKKYRQNAKRKQEEVKTEKEKLERENKELKFEIDQLNCKIQKKEQEIEQLKKEYQEREQQWKSALMNCKDGFGQLKREIHEKEQIWKSMQENETRMKYKVETLEAEAKDKLLKSPSCCCSCGQQCKTDAIEAQIRNERDNLKEQETFFKKILTGMDAKIRFYYYERKEAGWISFGKNVLEATITLFCARGGSLLTTKAH